MEINVAGAGAGKTSKMADLISQDVIPEGKFIFCIAFTNAAVEHIEKKILKKYGHIPKNIKISTIHSFLYQELIQPYYFLLYKKHFQKLSTIPLPVNPKFRNIKTTELEEQDILHITKIPEKAKWVVYKKSGDNKTIKDIRTKVLTMFAKYCHKIFIDEAQDINEEIKIIITALEQAGIEIVLYGDPKQDIRGSGCFQELIEANDNTKYICECFRCPQIHLNISNILASDNQKQYADSSNAVGSVRIVFESEVDTIAFLEQQDFGLKYISKKNTRFNTHDGFCDNRLDLLFYEVQRATLKKWGAKKTELAINRAAYYASENMLKNYDKTNNSADEIKNWIDKRLFDYPGNTGYAKMNSAFSGKREGLSCIPVVSSIESIKGLESKNCLFILTSDLAPYLFLQKKEDNKTKHLLYVALTRSLKDLTIMITIEVEASYHKENIKDCFSKLCEQ